MNRDDIIRMAREAYLVAWLPNSSFSDGIWWIEAHEVGSELEHFATLVASAEREACAKVADTISDKYGWGHYGNEVDTADEIAKAIRARGQA